MPMFTVAAFYNFTRFRDPDGLRAPLFDLAQANGVKGTILIAEEGINGTMAGPRAGVDAVLAHIRTLPGCVDLDWKESQAATMPFLRLKVRLKGEIVTMRQPNVDPIAGVGTYVQPEDWNDLIARDDVAVIDTRNDYEVGIGTFQGAIDPETDSFGEFPAWWTANKHRYAGKKIAMFCTGGIRCEKATNYLMGQGEKDVFHLKGGILKYLEDVPEDQSLWQGDCFVFDQRVSVGHGLVQGAYKLCHACRRPLSDDDKTHAAYEPGVSCHQCIAQFSDDDRARFRQRQRQIELARARGEVHIGDR